MEKMNDMLNAENKMMENKIDEMNKDNVDWMKKCSGFQSDMQSMEMQHEEAITLLVAGKEQVPTPVPTQLVYLPG